MNTAELAVILMQAKSTIGYALTCALELHSKPIGFRIANRIKTPLGPHLLETLDAAADLIDYARKVIQAKEKE